MIIGVGLILYRCLVEKQASGPLPMGFLLELTLSHHLPSQQKSSRLHHWLPQPQVPKYGTEFKAST
jgi:hypothetical protein